MMILIERVTLHRRFTMTLIRCNKYIIHTSDQDLAIDTIPYMLRLSEFVLRLLQNIVLASIHHHLDIMDVRWTFKQRSLFYSFYYKSLFDGQIQRYFSVLVDVRWTLKQRSLYYRFKYALYCKSLIQRYLKVIMEYFTLSN